MRLNIKRFSIEASNYTTLTSSAGNKARLEISWVENSTNVNNNTSNITVTGRIKMTSGAFAQDSVPYLKIYWHNTDKNTNTFLKQTQISDLSSSWVSISETTNQEHASDGTGSGYAYAEWTGSSFAYTPRAGSVSTSNTTLTKIPRVSTLSATTADIGSASTITITRGNSSFTDTITYSFTGNGITRTGTIVTKTNNPSVSFTLPGVNDDKNLYPLIPNDIEINGTLTCITYNGNSEVGRKDYPIKGTVPSTAKPTVRALTLTGSNPEITDTDTKSAAIGVFVQGKSKLSFNLANAFSTDYGSPVDYYELKINGTSVKNDTATTYTMQNALPNTSNTYELIIYDKRGNFGTSGEQPLTAYAYDIPKCSINVERNSSTPTTVTITYSGSITNVANNNQNAKSFVIEYRQAGSSSWVTPAIATITNTYTIASGTTMTKTGIDDNHGFEFRITATDSYNTPVTDTITISTSATLINFNANGQTLALGKASEISDTFEVDIKSKFLKDVNFTGAVTKNGTDILQPAYNRVGTLSSLTTTAKTNAVVAINEVNGKVGTLSSLTTSTKTDTVSAINELVTGMTGIKTQNLLANPNGWYMGGNQTVTLSANITDQTNGIVLVWSAYSSGKEQDYWWNFTVIPKTFVSRTPGKGVSCLLLGGNFEGMGAKYIYVNNGSLVGHNDNTASGTRNGITYNNAAFVLRYVVGF